MSALDMHTTGSVAMPAGTAAVSQSLVVAVQGLRESIKSAAASSGLAIRSAGARLGSNVGARVHALAGSGAYCSLAHPFSHNNFPEICRLIEICVKAHADAACAAQAS